MRSEPRALRGGKFRSAGGRKGRLHGDVTEMIRRVEEGFAFAAMEDFSKRVGLPTSEVARLVRMPPRTLARRRAAGRLGPDESERLLRISRVFEDAVELFEGDLEAARHWLKTPKKGLGGARPLEFARTEVGAREVEALIGRLGHGVFS